MGQLRSIQVLRGVAACGVVLLHALGARCVIGAAGVDLFFVISGFIMATIPKRPTFLLDRFWRILPMWWIALAVWWALNPAEHPVASLMLWPSSVPDLPVGWTLSFELLFYCAVALSVRAGVMPLLAMFGLMLAGAVLTRAPMFGFLGNPMILEFLFGALIAKLPKDGRLTLPLLVFGFGCLAFAPTWIYPPEFAMRAPASMWRVLYWGVPAAMIVYACLSVERLFHRRAWNGAVLLGNASYSIYLFHLLVTGLPWPVQVVGGISLGVAMWWFVERPLMSVMHRPWNRRVRHPDEAYTVGLVGVEVEVDNRVGRTSVR